MAFIIIMWGRQGNDHYTPVVLDAIEGREKLADLCSDTHDREGLISSSLTQSQLHYVTFFNTIQLVCAHVRLFSCVQLFVTPRTVAHQAPLPMGFSRQEYWSGLPFSPSGNLSDPGFEPKSPTSPALAGGIFTTEPPGSPVQLVYSFSFARSLNSRDWLYNTVPTLNNTVLCTWNYINWIDVMLRFLLSPFHQHTQELN